MSRQHKMSVPMDVLYETEEAEADHRQLQARIEEMEVNTTALMLTAKNLLVTVGFDAYHIDTDQYSVEAIQELTRLLEICRGGMHYV